MRRSISSRKIKYSCYKVRHCQKLSIPENKTYVLLETFVSSRIHCNTCFKGIRDLLQVDGSFLHWCFMLTGRSYKYQFETNAGSK